MKRLILLVFVSLVLFGRFDLYARDRFSVQADYNVPVGNEMIDPNLSLGATYRFWGIFTASANVYTDIVYGADNILNISSIQPLGLFSGGFGLQIPLGGLYLTMDWNKFFTGTISDSGIYDFCASYRIGLNIDLNEYVGVEVYSRKLFDFTDRAVADDNVRIVSNDQTVQTIGMGLVLNLF